MSTSTTILYRFLVLVLARSLLRFLRAPPLARCSLAPTANGKATSLRKSLILTLHRVYYAHSSRVSAASTQHQLYFAVRQQHMRVLDLLSWYFLHLQPSTPICTITHHVLVH